jgi:hypothetical protein
MWQVYGVMLDLTQRIANHINPNRTGHEPLMTNQSSVANANSICVATTTARTRDYISFPMLYCNAYRKPDKAQ